MEYVIGSVAQSGVIESRDFAVFLEMDVLDYGVMQTAVRFLLELLEIKKKNYQEDKLGVVVGFGSNLWSVVGPKGSASELKDFRAINDVVPATQRDLMVHIVGNRFSVLYTLALKFLQKFSDLVVVHQEIHAFRWEEDRDLSGFIDGTENPPLKEREEAVLIQEGEDIGGSYILVQRYLHHLDFLNKIEEVSQEKMIGRTKKDSIELDENTRYSNAHIAKVVIEEDGNELEILRHSLPYGQISGEKGLYFIAYSAKLSTFEKMLFSMFHGKKKSERDAILSFTEPKTGAYYFAPSLKQLNRILEI